jgi:hypothetical protein
MSANGFPIPIATPFFDGKSLSAPWARFLKWLGDDGLQANNLVDVRGVAGAKYTLNGNACLLTFEASPLLTPVDIPLPMRALAPFDLRYQKYVNSGGNVTLTTESVWYPSQTKKITIPTGARYAQAWYIVDPRASKE